MDNVEISYSASIRKQTREQTREEDRLEFAFHSISSGDLLPQAAKRIFELTDAQLEAVMNSVASSKN